ncbi:MAG: hypothetical protein Q9165_002851 [Trypethelium subeluteriae]
MASDPSWPPASGLGTKLVPRESVILPIYGSTTISAPAAQVWRLLIDTSSYESWCSFCPKVTIHSQPPSAPNDSELRLDTHFTFHVVMDSKKPTSYTKTQLRVTDISTPNEPSTYIPKDELESDPAWTEDLSRVYRIAWTTEGGFVARGLRSERFHEVIDRGEDSCEVRTWECQGGSLAHAVKWTYKKTLQQKFGEWCADLKKAAEEKHSSSQ